MLNMAGVWKRQFKPVTDGYLFYPSPKTGGKLVSHEEYEILLADWLRVARLTIIAAIATPLVVIALLITLIMANLAAPVWMVVPVLTLPLLLSSAWVINSAYAPHRLVRGRSEVTPPRPVADVGREGRAAITWPLVILVLLGSAVYFVRTVTGFDGTLIAWLWIVGSGSIMILYLGIAALKIADRRSDPSQQT